MRRRPATFDRRLADMRVGALSTRRGLLRRTGAVVALVGVVLAIGSAAAGAGEPAGPTVDIVEAEGVVDRPVARFLVEAVDRANATDSEAVLLSLDSPGALGPHYREVVDQVAASDVPVIVWVGPPGARAVGGAAAIAEAAHLLALSPGATLGPTEPADLHHGEPSGPAVTVSTASLGTGAEPVRTGEVLSAGDVVDRGAADLVAPTLDEVLRAAGGRDVTVPSGSHTLDIDGETANIRFDNLGVVRQVLHAMTHPGLVYLLVLAGLLTVAFEVFQPGFGVAGVAGLGILALGVYGLVVLPVSWPAVALLLLGVTLLGADLAVGGLGALSAGGALAMTGGSWWLYPGPDPLDISPWLIALGVGFSVLFFVVIMTVVLRAQGAQARAGSQAVVGRTGVVRSMLNPEGHVFVNGALWRARAPDEAGKVKTGTEVRVTGLNDRLTLDVELVDADSSPQEATHS